MAFDTTIYLETTSDGDNNFDFVNRGGNASSVQPDNTAGEWCLNTSGSTASSGTGASTLPAGRSGFIYTETSTPAESTVWSMTRNISFDASANNVFLDFKLNRYCDTGSTLYIEYSTEATPTTWTEIANYAGLTTEAWEDITIDFSAINSTTLWIRFRLHTLNAYTNDFCFSTWREYGTDKNTVIGQVYDDDSSSDEVNESAPNGETVGITAKAIDVDAGDTVSYSLTDDAVGRFAIDTNTGVVTVADAANIVYADATSHNITIRATSSDGSYSEMTKTINVISDAPASVTQVTDTDSANNEIMEQSPNGTYVGITAYAEDTNYADSVSYSLTDDANGRFTIDQTTGKVTLADTTQIVYADATTHTITVKATSTDGSATTMDVVINVLKYQLPKLAITNKFNTIKTTGTVYVDSGIGIDNMIIDGNMSLADVILLTKNFTLKNGVLNFETSGEYSFRDCIVDDVSNSSSGTVTINSLTSNFIANTGTNIVINVSVNITIHVEDESGNSIPNAFVYVDDNLTTTGYIINDVTDGNGDISGVYSGTAQTATVRVRKYGFKPYTSTIDVSSDASGTATLVIDPQQT